MLKTVFKFFVFFSILFFMAACPSPEDNGDADAVASDKEALTIEYGGADTADSVTADITLPATGTDGSDIAWESSNANVIGTDGSVTRPEPDAADAEITLTATISKGSAKDTKVFTLTVKKKAVAGDFTYTIPDSIAYGEGAVYPLTTNTVVGTSVEFALETQVTGITVAANGEITVAADLDAGAHQITVKATASGTAEAVTKAYTITIDPKSISGASLTYTELTAVRDASSGNTATPTTDLIDLLVTGDSLTDAVDFTIVKTGTSGTGTDANVSVDADGVVTALTSTVFTATEYTVTAAGKGNYADSATGTITVTVESPTIDGEFDYTIPASITYGEGAAYLLTSNTVSGELVAFGLENPVTGITVAANGEITVAADLDAGAHHITVKATASGAVGAVTKAYTINIAKKSISIASLAYDPLMVDRNASSGNTAMPTLASMESLTNLLVSGDNLSDAVAFTIAKTDQGPGENDAVSVDDKGVVTVITSTVFAATEYTVTATAKTDGNYDGSATGTISVTVNTPAMNGDFDYTIPASITYGDAPEYDISTNSITTTQGLTFALETPVTGITVAPGDGKITVAENLAVGDYAITVKATSADFTGEISQSETITVQKKSITGTTLLYTPLTLGVGVGTPDNTSASPTASFLAEGDTLADAVDFTIAKKNGPGPDTVGTIDTDGVITVETANNFTATDYTVTAAGKGNYAGSTTGDISITVTAGDRGPGKPGNFDVSTESNGDVKLTWDEPTDKGIHNNQTATITAYTIYYSKSSTFTKDNAETTIPVADPSLRSHTISSGLTAGTQYYFFMTATNAADEGTQTDKVSTYTNSAPGAPALTLATTDTGVSVSWDVTDLGYYEGKDATLTGIDIYYADQGGVTTTSGTHVQVTTTSATGSEAITIADPGVEYYFIATATNGAATGSPTSPAVSVTLDEAPGAPTSFTATGGTAEVTLNWDVPSELGYKDNAEGSITSYHIYYKEGSSVSTTDSTETAASTDRSKTISGLKAGTQYAFIMTAENEASEGAATTVKTVYTNAAPGAPTLDSVTGGDTVATLVWTEPGDTGYSGGSATAITGYYIYYSTISGFDKDATSGVTKSTPLGVGASPHTITGLTAGTQYYFIVTAENAADEGTASNEESTYTDGDPGAPTLTVTATSTGVSVGWTVSDPGYLGGSAASVTGIDIYYADQGGVTTTSGGTHVQVSTTSATGSEAITIDDPGVEYYFIATATTGAGTSVGSTEASVILNKAPGAPTSFTATGGDEEVTLNWAAPSDLGYVNGSEGSITGYAIYYKAGSSVTTSDYDTVTTAILTATSKTITGLSTGTQYHFIMTASNDHAESVPTDERATHTDTVPEKPTGVSLSGGDQRVTLTWTAPGNTGYVGGSAGTLTGYNIYYSQNSGVTVENGTKHEVNSGTATTQEISGLTTTGTYYFIMTAKTAAGESLPTTAETFTISPAFSSGEVTMIVNEIITRVGTAASEQVTFGGSLTAGADYTLSLQRPPGANASVTINDATGLITVANTVAAADGGQYTVIATGTGGKKLSAAFTLTLYDTDLADLLLNGDPIPADLSGYDAFTQAILADYNGGATMTALYFTENGAGNKDGSSWANAFPGADLRGELQRVTHYAAADNKIYFILVGAGTYKPTSQMTMWGHTAIIGGWPASGGWIRGGAETIFDGEKQRRLFANLINSVTNAKLYGAVIQNGRSSSADGGAVFNGGSTTTFIDVRFLNNTSGRKGGAVYDSGGSIKFSNVTFEGNTSTKTSDGGGALFSDGSTIEFTDVVFKDNKADAYGGAQYNLGSSLEYSRVKFLNNESGKSGGALYSSGGSVKFSHAIFDGNKNNSEDGGAVHVTSTSSASLSHVTFKDNTAARNGGGLYFWNTPNAKVSHATFHGNQGLGSAVGMNNGSAVWLNQATITENTGDAVIHQVNSSSVITNTLIWGNKASNGTSIGLTFRLEPTAGKTDVLTVYNSLWAAGTWEYNSVKGVLKYGAGTADFTLGNNIITDGSEDPVLGSLMTTGDEYLRTYTLNANTQAQDAGIYVQRGTDGTYYYSTDNTAWFSDPGLTTSVTLPGGTEELTAQDVRGNSRNGAPDIGAYEL